MPELLRLQLTSENDQAREIAELYWSQDEEGLFVYRVAEIAETYGMSSREVREAANQGGVAESIVRRCGSCGSGLLFKSRNEVSMSGSYRRDFICDDCRHHEATERRDAERRLIAERYAVPSEPSLNCSTLALEDAVALYAMIRQCSDESHSRILPVQTASQRIGPGQYIYDLLNELYEEILWVDPDSDSEAFDWETGAPDRFYLGRVRWQVAGSAEGLARVAADLRGIFEEKDWPSHWDAEAAFVQRRIAVHELADYLVARLAEHHFQFSPGPKTWEILRAIASGRSIGEGYNLIWRAARDAASFYVREGCSKKRATSYAIGVLRRSFEQAESKGWSLKGFARDWNLPQSEVSHLFFGLFIGVDDEMKFPPIPTEDFFPPDP
jgi:hypothetical protein